MRESEEQPAAFEEGPSASRSREKTAPLLQRSTAHFVKCWAVTPRPSSLQLSFIDITHPDDLRTDVDLAGKIFRGELPFYHLRQRYVKKNDGENHICLE